MVQSLSEGAHVSQIRQTFGNFAGQCHYSILMGNHPLYVFTSCFEQGYPPPVLEKQVVLPEVVGMRWTDKANQSAVADPWFSYVFITICAWQGENIH